MDIIGTKSKDVKIYSITVGTGTMYDRKFQVYACDEHEAIDLVADFCEENGLHGVYILYDEISKFYEVKTSADRAQIHKMTCCGKNKIFIEFKKIEYTSIDNPFMYECTGESKLEKILEMHLIELDLSNHTFCCLREQNIITILDLLKKTYCSLLKIEGLGQQGADEVVEKLSLLGLYLKDYTKINEDDGFCEKHELNILFEKQFSDRDKYSRKDANKEISKPNYSVEDDGFSDDYASEKLLNKQFLDIDKYAREDVDEDIYEFNYSIDDQGVIIEGYLGDSTEVIIPENIEGLPVYKIADDAFSEDELIEKIMLPKTLRIIGAGAFECSNLSFINLQNGLKTIDDCAFFNSNLTSIKLPEGLEVMGECSFAETNISNINIPRSVQQLGEGAFASTNIETILIPDSIDTVPERLCEDCSKLHTVIIQGADMIDSSAFENCCVLQKIYLPNTLTNIYENAFRGTALKKIIIPASVEFVGDGNYPEDSHVAFLSDTTEIDEIEDYGDNVTFYCNQANHNVRTIAREIGITRKPLSAFPKD